MNIRVGTYRLTAGPNDFEISEVKTGLTGKRKGKEVITNTQYFPSIESALNNVLKRRLLKSDATALADLLNELKTHRTELQELFKALI